MKPMVIAATFVVAFTANAQPDWGALCPESEVPTAQEYANEPTAYADDFCALAWHEPSKATAQLGKMVGTTRARANANRYYFPFDGGTAEPVQVRRPGMEEWTIVRLPLPYQTNTTGHDGVGASWLFYEPDGTWIGLILNWEVRDCSRAYIYCPDDQNRAQLMNDWRVQVHALEAHRYRTVRLPTLDTIGWDRGRFLTDEVKCVIEALLDDAAEGNLVDPNTNGGFLYQPENCTFGPWSAGTE